MQETLNRLALRRAFNRSTAEAPVVDFEDDATGRIGRALRPTVIALIVGSLGLLGAGGIAMAAAATSTEQSNTTLVVDADQPDNSKAEPQNLKLDANQKAAQADADAQNTGEDGSGGLFGQRGTTPNRNAVRAELSKTLANAKGVQRATSLQESDKSVTDAQAKAEAAEREKLMNADVEKVKAEAERIEEEKRKAAELLKQLQAQAAADAAKNQQSTTQADSESGSESGSTTTNGFKLSNADVQAISQGGGAFPLKAGTYSVGASFGKTGSWSRYHTGQDFPAATGTPVYAASSGVVSANMSAAGWAGSKYVTINHANGSSTLYAHLSGRVVSAGQPVKAGQLIGYVGNEGRSFGSHLHFEYYPAGTLPGDVYSAADPMAWLRSIGVA
ncbi:peptidoglycan DD-metalloendopeptidase family protein [Propionibacteriaceae bacterium Y1923]|uniref:peptidoglycan DD-metalloendopeptidase family protein n=1 Tax=Aestuariimicrobium sp. Y1814 TaxID=3418742 RepID=UPI003C144DCF